MQAGIHLRRWWADFLGVPFPPYSWEHLAGMRWGPDADLEPGIMIDVPNPSRRRLALESLGTGPGDASEAV